MTSVAETEAAGSRIGLLDRERIIARPGFDRWLVPPAALAIESKSAFGPVHHR